MCQKYSKKKQNADFPDIQVTLLILLFMIKEAELSRCIYEIQQ